MKNGERYVVFWCNSLIELKALHEVTRGYLKSGQCFTCTHVNKTDCNDYPLQMFMTRRHLVPFGQRAVVALKFIKFLLSKSDRINFVMLFDNIKNRLFVYRTELGGDEFKTSLLPHLLQEYDLLFTDVSQQYELYDLRDRKTIRNVKPEIVKDANWLWEMLWFSIFFIIDFLI